ncbi:MAG: hypothetical protein ACOYLV_09500 [Rubrivivax sp.]
MSTGSINRTPRPAPSAAAASATLTMDLDTQRASLYTQLDQPAGEADTRASSARAALAAGTAQVSMTGLNGGIALAQRAGAALEEIGASFLRMRAVSERLAKDSASAPELRSASAQLQQELVRVEALTEQSGLGQRPEGRSSAPGRGRGNAAGSTMVLTSMGTFASAQQLMSEFNNAGSDMQAWLDIATGRLALKAVVNYLSEGVPEAPAPAPAPAPAAPPAPAPAAPVLQLRSPEDAQSAMQTLDDALDVVDLVRGRFSAALDRFDTQLSGLAANLTGTRSGEDSRQRMATLAETSQARMLRKPQEAVTAQGRPFPAGALDLLRSDAIQIVWGADGGALART